MRLDTVRLVVQLALGAVFLVSTAGKLRRPAAFLRGVAEYEILPRPLAYLFGAVLIPVEAFLAVAHLTGWGLGIAAPLGMAVLTVFAVAVAVSLRRNRDLLCLCFSSVGGERVSVRSLAQIALLAVGEVLVWSGLPSAGLSWHRVASPWDVALAFTWALCCLLAGLWLLRADEVFQLFRPYRCKTCSRPRDLEVS